MTKNAYFGPNLAVLGPNILIPIGGSKSFGTHVTEKPTRHLVCILFGRPRDQMGQKCQNLAQKANLWPNLAVLEPKILIFMGVSKSFGTNITENHFGNLSALFFGHALDEVGQKCQYLAQKANFGPNLAL